MHESQKNISILFYLFIIYLIPYLYLLIYLFLSLTPNLSNNLLYEEDVAQH